MFDDVCLKEFECLKKKLILAPIIVSPNQSMPFNIICDVSGVALVEVIEKKE